MAARGSVSGSPVWIRPRSGALLNLVLIAELSAPEITLAVGYRREYTYDDPHINQNANQTAELTAQNWGTGLGNSW